MLTVDRKLLDSLSAKARQSERKRTIFKFHKTDSDNIHRMLNAMEPDTYIPPHKHENPDKREAFWVLRGKIALVIFDDDGSVREYTVLSPETGNYGAELPARTWHCLICLQTNSVAYEVKDGPWNPENDKHFAPWAPNEGDEIALDYMYSLMSDLNLHFE